MAAEERGNSQSSRGAQVDNYGLGVKLLSASDFEGAIAAFTEWMRDISVHLP